MLYIIQILNRYHHYNTKTQKNKEKNDNQYHLTSEIDVFFFKDSKRSHKIATIKKGMSLGDFQTHFDNDYYLLAFLRNTKAVSNEINPKKPVVVAVVPVFDNDFLISTVFSVFSLVLTGVATKVSLTSD